jgi:hypothetical protein
MEGCATDDCVLPLTAELTGAALGLAFAEAAVLIRVRRYSWQQHSLAKRTLQRGATATQH